MYLFLITLGKKHVKENVSVKRFENDKRTNAHLWRGNSYINWLRWLQLSATGFRSILTSRKPQVLLRLSWNYTALFQWIKTLKYNYPGHSQPSRSITQTPFVKNTSQTTKWYTNIPMGYSACLFAVYMRTFKRIRGLKAHKESKSRLYALYDSN